MGRKVITLADERTTRDSRRLERELDPDRIIGKFDPAVLDAAEHAGRKQRLHVAVHGLHVALHAPRGLANRHRTGARHGAQDLPALGRENLPYQLGRRETNAGALSLPAKCRYRPVRYVLAGRDFNRYGFHDRATIYPRRSRNRRAAARS